MAAQGTDTRSRARWGPALALAVAAQLAGARAAAQSSVEASVSRLAPQRLEPGAAPIFAANSDLGVIFGGIVSLARFHPVYDPFRWRVELLTLMTAKGGIVFQDHYAKLDLPGVLDGRLRLWIKLAFSRHSNIGYYGIGNASVEERDRGPRVYEYDRISPEARVQARMRITDALDAMVGAALIHNVIEVYAGSKLEEDLASGDPLLLSLLRGVNEHAVLVSQVGLIWDTRNHELTPSAGAFHEAS